MLKRSTRQDVAKKAGVSGATVSRVFNNPEQVQKETRDKVLAAAQEFDFHPNKNAAALRKRNSGVILFLELDIPGFYQWTEMPEYRALYGDIIRALLHRVQNTLFSLQLVSLVSVDQIRLLPRRYNFDGILGFDINQQDSVEELKKLGVPVVCAHHTQLVSGISTVSTDNFAGMANLTAELKQKNYHKPLYVTGLSQSVISHRLRLEGFRSVWKNKAEVWTDVLGYEQGCLAGKKIAQLFKEKKLDSVCAVNDLTAFGIIQSLQDLGIPVGFESGQLPVTGYDNLPAFSKSNTDFMTTEAHLPEIYIRAFSLLEELLKSPLSDMRHEVVLPTLIKTPARK